MVVALTSRTSVGPRPFCQPGPQARKSALQRKRCTCLHVRAESKESKSVTNRLAPPLLALALWTGFTFAVPDVHHLTASAEERVSKYDKRVADAQERKKLLTQAREKALAKGGVPRAMTPEEIAVLKAEDPEVLAANKEVEAANERRKKDSEGLKLSADAYSSQTKKSSSSQKSSLRGISYSPSDADSSPSGPNRRLLSTMSFEIADAEETPSAPKFDFEEPPTVPQPPKVSKPNAPSDPTSDPNAFSSVPIPSAVAPAQPEQQIEGTSKESDNSFGGLFDLEKTSTKLQAVPEAPVQKAKEAASKVQAPSIPDVKQAVPDIKQAVPKAVEPKARLPLFAAQLLLLLAYGGLGFLAFKKDEETRKAIAFVTGLFQKGYTKIANLLPSGSK